MKTNIYEPEPYAFTDNVNSAKKVSSITFPIMLLIFYVFFEYGRPLFLAAIKPVFLVTALLTLCLINTKHRLFRVLKERFFVAFLLLLLVMSFNVFIAENNYWAFVYLKTMIVYLVIGLSCCVFLDSIERLKKFLFVMVMVITLCAVNRLLKHDILGISGRGVFGDENDFALLMNMVLPISFFLGRAETGWRRCFLWVAAVIFVLANVACASRGGFLGLAVVGLVCFYYMDHKFTALVVIAVIVVVGWTFAAPDFKAEITAIGVDSAEKDTGKDRVELWKIGWRAFLDNPVFGVGQGNIPVVMDIYKYDNTGKTYFKQVKWGRAIHSIYFTLLSELGLVGVILLFLMLNDLLHKYKKVRRLYEGRHLDESLKFAKNMNMALLVSVCGFIVSGAFLSVFYYPMFWHISAIMVTLYLMTMQYRPS